MLSFVTYFQIKKSIILLKKRNKFINRTIPVLLKNLDSFILSISITTTLKISYDFFSYKYLDVSIPYITLVL